MFYFQKQTLDRLLKKQESKLKGGPKVKTSSVFHTENEITPLLIDKILDWSKLEEFADDKSSISKCKHLPLIV